MTAWASMLVPAGSVVVGALVAGGAAVGGQFLTHRGSFQREREARRDAFRVARFETERETLLSLQAAILEHLMLLEQFVHPTSDEDRDRAQLALIKNGYNLTTLSSRCLAHDAAKAVTEFCRESTRVLTTPELFVTLGDSFTRAQMLLGLALRQDPFEDDR